MPTAWRRCGAAVLLVSALGLVACGERGGPPTDTAVMGGSGPDAALGESGQLRDAGGRPIPRPDLPPSIEVRMTRTGEASAVAVWLQDGTVLTASFERGSGWSAPQPIEQIYGEASDPQLAGNGQGQAMALWRHTVGSIQSLRYSRFDPGAGWSPADVVPGALPRPHAGGVDADGNAPHLQLDAQGEATARWPSGFDPSEMQVARYLPGRGWTRPASEPLAAAAGSASAAAPAR